VPIEYQCELKVYGPDAALARFREDRTWWQVEPWASCFLQPKIEPGPKPNSLVYTYDTDVKRPGPSVSEMSAAYPELTLVEVCDSGGFGADGALTYVKGRKVPNTRREKPLRPQGRSTGRR